MTSRAAIPLVGMVAKVHLGHVRRSAVFFGASKLAQLMPRAMKAIQNYKSQLQATLSGIPQRMTGCERIVCAVSSSGKRGRLLVSTQTELGSCFDILGTSPADIRGLIQLLCSSEV